MTIKLVKGTHVKEVSIGFSWKSLLFGIFYPMARNDFKGALMQFLLCFFTLGAAWCVIPFVYNKRFISRLLEDGYKPVDTKSKDYVSRKLNQVFE